MTATNHPTPTPTLFGYEPNVDPDSFDSIESHNKYVASSRTVDVSLITIDIDDEHAFFESSTTTKGLINIEGSTIVLRFDDELTLTRYASETDAQYAFDNAIEITVDEESSEILAVKINPPTTQK
jgi:hypothetical protein